MKAQQVIVAYIKVYDRVSIIFGTNAAICTVIIVV
jgi:hypothetical protein